jgi:glycosyltransferase involved in cell wall biosynthesis
MKKRFITIFDRAKNFHLVKDVGQVPYHMYKEHGYDSILVTCKNDNNYKYLDNEVKGLKLEFIPNFKLFKINFGVIFYLIKNAKKIDVLHQFHIRNYTLLYALVYKLFNNNGVNYLKADANEKSLIHRGYIVKKKHLKSIDKYIDFISFETSNVVEIFKKENPLLSSKVIKIPNGVDENYIIEKLNISNNNCKEKENIIVYVARIGTHQKNTELFLDSLEKVELGNWKVHLIGEINPKFNNYIESFFLNNIHLKDKVIFHGNISSREKIYKYYAKSKIFCMSSRYEGFPLVYPEVLYFGNYIFTTDVSGAKDITNNEKYGMIINDFSTNEYSKKLENLIKNYESNIDLCNEIKSFAKENYTWQSIIAILNNNIRKKI